MEEQQNILEEQEQQGPLETDGQPKPKPKFNPKKSFTPVQEAKPPFDPNKPAEPVKKKDGITPSSTGGNPLQNQQKIFSGLNKPAVSGNAPVQKTEEAETTNIPKLKQQIKESKVLVLKNGIALPVPQPHGEFGFLVDDVEPIKDLQFKIDNGIGLSIFDKDKIAKVTGKPVQAVDAYIKGDEPLAKAYETEDVVKKNKAELKGVIAQFNADFGYSKNADEILGSAEKTAEFFNEYEASTTDRNSKYFANAVVEKHREAQKLGYDDTDIDAATRIVLEEKKEQLTAIKSKFDFQQKILADHIVKTTAYEDYVLGVPRETTANKIAQRINPREYRNAQKALKIQSGLDGLTDQSTVFDVIGAVVDEVSGGGKFKDEMLNSVLGYADIQLNDAYMRIANEKAAAARLSGDDNLMTEAKLIYANIDKNILRRYPAIQMQQMAEELAKDIAKEAGQLVGSDTEDYDLKWAGLHGQEDYILKLVTEKGWLSDPDKKPLATRLLENPDLIKDASYLGGVKSSFLQPFKDLGLSIMDITGVRTFKDIYSDKTKDELFPKEFNPDETKNSFSILGHDFKSRSIANGISNLAGLVSISAITEGAVGGAMTPAATKRLAAYTSFGIPSIDANIKDSYNFIDDDAERAAFVTLGVLINGEGGALLDLGKISRVPGMREDFMALSKNIVQKNLTESAKNELLKKAENKYVNFVMKYGKVAGNVTKETLKGAATMAYFTFGNEYNKLLNGDPNTKSEDLLPHAAGAFMEGVFTMLPFGFVAGMKGVSNQNSSYKEMINKIATFPDSAQDAFRLTSKNQKDFDYKMSVLNTARVSKNALEATERETGIKLDQGQRSAYIANKTIEASLREKAATTTNESKKEEYLKDADALAEQSTQTLDGLKFSPTLVPLYDLYEAEKKYNEEYEKFHAGNAKEDAALLSARDNFESLQYKYFKNPNATPESEIVKVNGTTVTKSELQEILDKGKEESDKYDIEYTGTDDGLHTQLRKFGAETVNNFTVSPKGRDTVNLEAVNDLYGKLEGKEGLAPYLDPTNKEDSIEQLTNQALTAPAGVHSGTGYNEKLTVELIARNSTEAINKSIDKWSQAAAKEGATPSELKDADRHIRLLEKGLEFKSGIHKESAAQFPELKNEEVADAFEKVKEGTDEVPDSFNAKGGNKIVDENGNPKKVYHVTTENFKDFDLDKTAQGIIWFTDSKKSIEEGTTGAGLYPGKKPIVMEREVDLKNPAGWAEYEKYGLGELKDKGFDGVILPDKDKTDYIIFDTKSIREPAKENAEAVANLEKERDDKINEVIRPDLKLELVSSKDLVESKDPISNREKHNEIKERYKNLKKLLDCL